MTRFIALEPQSSDGSPNEKYQAVALLPVGFSYGAFSLGPVWLLAKGLWLEALAVLLAGAFVVLPILLAAPFSGLAIATLIGWFVGLEGRNWVIAKKERKGWQAIAEIVAASEDEAEWQLAQVLAHGNSALVEPGAQKRPESKMLSKPPQGTIGLFPTGDAW
jgi:hypothetical protein